MKYLNKIVAQDHRAIKRRTRPMTGFKSFLCARILLGGIELMHMITKGQMQTSGLSQTPAVKLYSREKKGIQFYPDHLSSQRLIATCMDPTPFASFRFAFSKRSAHMYPACPVGDCRSTPAALMRSAHAVLKNTSARLDDSRRDKQVSGCWFNQYRLRFAEASQTQWVEYRVSIRS